jgi:hypothetical protein
VAEVRVTGAHLSPQMAQRPHRSGARIVVAPRGAVHEADAGCAGQPVSIAARA